MFKLCWRIPCAVVTAILASGCASLPLEQGRSGVQSLVRAHVPVAAAADAVGSDGAQARISEWLAAPLGLEQAQQIALLRNPALKAHYARLGLSAAEVFEAGRLQNPSLGVSWLLPLAGADGTKVGASLMMSFADLLLRGARQRIAGAEFAAMQEQIAADTLEVMAATQRAWFACVAANQRVAVRRSIAEAARLGADLAQQYREAGNISALEHQVQRAEASQARIALQEAQMELADARAELQKQMGLAAGQSRWTVPEVLPDMPAGEPPALEPLLAKVLEQRLDVSAARRQVQALRERRDAAHRYRLLADSRVGAALDREADGAKRLGPSVEFALPLFHQGQGAVARADAQLAAGESQLAELEVAVQAELARQVSRIGLAREQVKAYREGLIPEREAVVARLAEQANFMLVDSFAVLMARQQEYAAYDGYVDAMLKFWTAQVDLLRAAGSLRGLEESR